MRYDPAAFRLLVFVALTAFLLNPMIARAQQELPYERIAALAHGSLMITVGEGLFLMGTAKTGHDLYSLDLPYDDTEQPQRHVWLDRFEIDRDEVSLGEFILWLNRRQRSIPAEIRKLIDHMMTVHAMPPEILARWPALYVTWTEASDYCRAQNKRLPTEAEWEKAARGTDGRLFPWGNQIPSDRAANFGLGARFSYSQALVPVQQYETGRSPYGLYQMAGNAGELVADWYGAAYYDTSPLKNPSGPD